VSPELIAFYSNCIDEALGFMKEGKRVLLCGNLNSSWGTIDLQSHMLERESKFKQTNEPEAQGLDSDSRARALLCCIYEDLKSISAHDSQIFNNLLSSFKSRLGGLVATAFQARSDMLPSIADFLKNIDLNEYQRVKTLPSMMGVALLCRAVKQQPENPERLTPGIDYSVGEYLSPTKPPKLPPLKERWAELEGHIADSLLAEVSSELFGLLPRLAAHLSDQHPRAALLSDKAWAKTVNVWWPNNNSQQEFDELITQDVKKEVLVILHRVFTEKAAKARELRFTLDQLKQSGSPFYLSGVQYVTCTEAIDSFAINQIKRVWDDTGQIPYMSFAMSERRMKAYEVAPPPSGGEPILVIKYWRGGEEKEERFIKASQSRNSSLKFPVCVWVLNKFMSEALECRSKNRQ
jgi:hypothetical protein